MCVCVCGGGGFRFFSKWELHPSAETIEPCEYHKKIESERDERPKVKTIGNLPILRSVFLWLYLLLF